MVYFENQPEEVEEIRRYRESAEASRYISPRVFSEDPFQRSTYKSSGRTGYPQRQETSRYSPNDLGYTVEKTSRPYNESPESGNALAGAPSSTIYV